MKTTEANINKILKLYFFPYFHKPLKLNIHKGHVTMSITLPFHIPSQFTFTMSTIDTYLKILNLSCLISNRFSFSSTTKVQHQSVKFVFPVQTFIKATRNDLYIHDFFLHLISEVIAQLVK